MTAKPKVQPDDPEQFKRFKEAARELGVDDDPQALEHTFGRIVPPKVGTPKPHS